MKGGDRLWDVGLGLVTLALLAAGATDAKNLQTWVLLAALVFTLIVVRSQRHLLGRWIVKGGVWIGGEQAVARPTAAPPPLPDPAIERAREAQREVLGAVRDLVEGAMVHSTNDRERGMTEERTEALAAASRAAARAHELDDAQAVDLVVLWKANFDAIPKGWKEGIESALGYVSGPPGYPEPAWGVLRQSADAAISRLGALLRDL